MTRLFIVLFLLFSQALFAQSDTPCPDTLYDGLKGFVAPQYKDGEKGLMNYLSAEVIPLITSCSEKDSALTTKIYIALRINAAGEVVETRFKKDHLSADCKEKMNRKLLSMKGWIPATLNGRTVCGNYVIPVSCIKYD